LSLVAIVARDLIIATRIAEAAAAAGREAVRVDEPADLPDARNVAIAFVDWGERAPGWGGTLASWVAGAAGARPRLIVFGPHTDIEAHRAARSAGIGPMLARSALVARLGLLLDEGA
jgi:hypothetical protein